MALRVQSQIEAEIGFLRKVHGVTLRDKVRNSGIRQSLNIKPILGFEGWQLLQQNFIFTLYSTLIVLNAQ